MIALVGKPGFNTQYSSKSCKNYYFCQKTAEVSSNVFLNRLFAQIIFEPQLQTDHCIAQPLGCKCCTIAYKNEVKIAEFVKQAFYFLFRSRNKFSTTYAIVLFFFVFFFSRPFHENFKFLKHCPYDFHEILHSHSAPKGAPACAKASKSYGWDVRNIAKISPKMAKKQRLFDFFRFSQKLSIRFERNFLQSFYSFYTIIWSFMCSFIKFVWLGCEKHSQIQPKNGQKNSHFSIFSIFSRIVHTIRTKANQKEKDLSRLLYRICGSGFKIGAE